VRNCSRSDEVAPSRINFVIADSYTSIVNADIYMKFREAVDSLCSALTHEDVAKALGVSVQTIRQARMKEDSKSYREPPNNW
jgi:hypothetical protein